jgi:hypothetical protein
MTSQHPDNHAYDSADNWLTTIRELVANYRAATAVDDIDDTAQAEINAAAHAIYEAPLSVEVRSSWHDPVRVAVSAEYQILLSFGGPSVRITGDLDGYAQPDTARLEYQDWGTPWTAHPLTAEEAEDVLTFAQQFHYGE